MSKLLNIKELICLINEISEIGIHVYINKEGQIKCECEDFHDEEEYEGTMKFIEERINSFINETNKKIILN